MAAARVRGWQRLPLCAPSRVTCTVGHTAAAVFAVRRAPLRVLMTRMSSSVATHLLPTGKLAFGAAQELLSSIRTFLPVQVRRKHGAYASLQPGPLVLNEKVPALVARHAGAAACGGTAAATSAAAAIERLECLKRLTAAFATRAKLCAGHGPGDRLNNPLVAFQSAPGGASAVTGHAVRGISYLHGFAE